MRQKLIIRSRMSYLIPFSVVRLVSHLVNLMWKISNIRFNALTVFLITVERVWIHPQLSFE